MSKERYEECHQRLIEWKRRKSVCDYADRSKLNYSFRLQINLERLKTMNKTDNSLMFSMHINVNHILTFLFVIIAIVGILGNLLVIISVEFDARMRRSLTNQLIVRVASCDFLILIFNIPDLVQFVSSPDGNWILNQLACKLIRTTLVLAQYASVLTMCALTIERYLSNQVSFPVRMCFFLVVDSSELFIHSVRSCYVKKNMWLRSHLSYG